MPSQALPAMFLVAFHTLLRPPPLTKSYPLLMANPSGVYLAACPSRCMPFDRPLPMAPTTPVFFTHSMPEWTLSLAQCATSPALCLAQSTAPPTLLATQELADL